MTWGSPTGKPMPNTTGEMQEDHLEELREIADHERLEHEVKPPKHGSWWRFWRRRRK